MDFSYGNTVLQSSSGFKPLKTNVPLDIRTVVDTYADIANIPNPFVGMNITVKVDETNDGKMTDYKVKSLKANALGMPNTAVDKVVKMTTYLEALSNVSFEQIINSVRITSATRTVQIPEYNQDVTLFTVYVNSCLIKNYTMSSNIVTFGFNLEAGDIVSYEIVKVAVG